MDPNIDEKSNELSKPLKINTFDFDINPDDLYLVGDSLLDQKGLISHHIESANHFYRHGISQIITQGFRIEKHIMNRRGATPEDNAIHHIHCEVIPTDVQLKPPTTIQYRTSKETVLYPRVALVRKKIYSGTLSISCDIKATATKHDGTVIERTDSVKNFRISRVPIIKNSIMCNTYKKSKESLEQLGEDPSDPGGYFIVKGEWAVDCTENITFNQPKIYINVGYGKSRLRCEFISKPGDAFQNSEYLLIRFFNDDTLTLEVARDKMMNIQIPFYLVFRALGWNNDKDMIDWIVYDYENDANIPILNNIVAAINAKYGKTAYRSVYDQQDALRAIVDLIPEENYKYLDLKKKPENYALAIADVLRIFDTYCLPHIGTTAAARNEKLKFLGLLIRKVLLVYLGHIPQTDRDSYRNKRIHAAGDNYAKVFKTYFNQTVVMPIKRRMTKDFNSSPFSRVNLSNLVKSAIYAEDFERLIVQTIVSGNRASLKVKRREVINRLAAQAINRKNNLNLYATMRQVSATSADSAKQSERASEMRRVHMSQIGYICLAHSPPEGEKVGINKQMAMFATIAPASSSEVLKKLIIADPDIIQDTGMSPTDIYRSNFARVYVNGHLIGYTRDSIELVKKYRKKRRALEINHHTTIYWDNTQNEVQFFVDTGRITRPLIIVYNNKRDAEYFAQRDNKSAAKANTTPTVKFNPESNTKEFQQGIAITQEDIVALYQKKKTIEDLLREQKVEFITPEEQEICYVCPYFDQLARDKNNELVEYTHLDIPQSILGLTALTAPCGNHNQAPRVTFQTSQAKQTCGYYALNWPHRMDKETFLQYVNELPLVRTYANKYIFPNGVNVMVAMMCYTGYNQEDSLIVNKAAIERGLFDGSKFTFYETEFEQKEEKGNPDASKTDGLKSANYEKLVNGVVPEGTHLAEDDVIIGKYMPIAKGTESKYTYVDRSIVYKEDEPAIVHKVIEDHNEDALFCKVGLRKIREVAVGDKFCLTDDHEVLTTSGWKNITSVTQADSVYTLNPVTHALEIQQPTNTVKFEHQGSMYEISNGLIDLKTTLNHKMYVKRGLADPYELVEARDIRDQPAWYKRDCHNKLSANNIRADINQSYHAIDKKSARDELFLLTTNPNISKCVEPDGHSMKYEIFDKSIADYIQFLAIMSEYTATLTTNQINNETRYIIEIAATLQTKLPSTDHAMQQITEFNGFVYCIEVPNHIFMVRRNNKYCWTGNSSRAG